MAEVRVDVQSLVDELDRAVDGNCDLDAVWIKVAGVFAQYGLIGDKQASLIAMSADPDYKIVLKTEDGFIANLYCYNFWIVGTPQYGYWVFKRTEDGKMTQCGPDLNLNTPGPDERRDEPADAN